MRSRIGQLLIASAILLSPMANAQDGGEVHDKKDPKAMAERKTAHMAGTLQLTPEQTEKVKEINLRYAEKRSAMRAQQMDTKKASMEELRTSYSGELNKVLTPEQIAKHEAMQKERAAAHGKKRKGQRIEQERAAPDKPTRQ